MHYRFFKKELIDSGDYAITSFRKEDLQLIKCWRNEQLRVLRQQTALTDEDQTRYYQEFIAPSMTTASPRIILVSYLHKGACIGYGGLTNVDWETRRAEVSYLAETSRTTNLTQYAQDFAMFLSLLKVLAFDCIGLNRMFTETYDIRAHHIAVLEASGFHLEGRLRQHIAIEGTFADVLFHGILRENLHA